MIILVINHFITKYFAIPLLPSYLHFMNIELIFILYLDGVLATSVNFMNSHDNCIELMILRK